MTNIHLIGSLGRRFGEKWTLDVRSPAEAIRAIDINLKGALSEYLSGPARNKPYKVALQKRENVIGADEVTHRSGMGDIYIIPTIRGANSGLGKIVVGVGLLALAYFSAGATAGSSLAVLFGGATAQTTLIGFGVSFLLGGITQALTPNPQSPTTQSNSFAFPGNSTSVVQGGCVPLLYGRALTTPVPIAITTLNNDISTTVAGTVGVVTVTPLDGGGYQYSSQDN